MKKLAILATMFAVVTLASCGGDKNAEGENTDTTATSTEPVTEPTPEPTTPEVDTTATDTAAHAE